MRKKLKIVVTTTAMLHTQPIFWAAGSPSDLEFTEKQSNALESAEKLNAQYRFSEAAAKLRDIAATHTHEFYERLTAIRKLRELGHRYEATGLLSILVEDRNATAQQRMHAADEFLYDKLEHKAAAIFRAVAIVPHNSNYEKLQAAYRLKTLGYRDEIAIVCKAVLNNSDSAPRDILMATQLLKSLKGGVDSN